MAAVLAVFAWGMAGCGVQTGYVPDTVPLHRLTGLSGPPAAAIDSLLVVSWNIQYADRVPEAILELQTDPRLAEADLILLQEMDPGSSRAVAEAFGFHLVHGSSMISPHDADLFGNAVLSRWPIRDAGAVMLPHATPWTGHRRSAVWADIDLGPAGVLRAISIHAATMIVDQDDRFAQYRAPVDSLGGGPARLVYGGDFNTVSDYEVTMLWREMRQRGLQGVRLPPGPTISNRIKRLPGSEPVLDHLFVRGLGSGDAGVQRSATASDHYPVWAVLRLENTTEQNGDDPVY